MEANGYSAGSLLNIRGATLPRLQRIATGYATPVDELWACPWKLIAKPDRWQRTVLTSPNHNWLLCCSRQVGKTEVSAASAVWEAMACASFVLIISASEAQAFEFLARVKQCYYELPLVPLSSEPTKSEMLFENGARILALPNNEKTVRVYSKVGLLIVDEAARVPDSLYFALSPMLAVSRGRQIVLSTPFGKRGFFYNEWSSGQKWKRARVPHNLCARIPADFIEDERRRIGEVWFKQEYCCEFLDTQCGIFDVEAFEDLVVHETPQFIW